MSPSGSPGSTGWAGNLTILTLLGYGASHSCKPLHPVLPPLRVFPRWNSGLPRRDFCRRFDKFIAIFSLRWQFIEHVEASNIFCESVIVQP